MSYKVLVDTGKVQANMQAMREIEAAVRINNSAAYNTNTEISEDQRNTYLEQEARGLDKIIKKYARTIVKTVEYSNGLNQWAYLDKDGLLVCELTSKEPEYSLVKLGRPQEMQGGKRRQVYLDDASWDKAVSLGNGNASDGIRVALLRAGVEG